MFQRPSVPLEHEAMGCTQAKISVRSPRVTRLQKLKFRHGYLSRGRGRQAIVREKENGAQCSELVWPESANGHEDNEGDMKKNCGGTEMGGGDDGVSDHKDKTLANEEKVGECETTTDGDGWPKWLVDYVPIETQTRLVTKSSDSYTKLAKVGEGAYSNVYKAREKESGKIVALKRVWFDLSKPESVRFMVREILILQALDHPNVIKLHGIAKSRMQYYLYLVLDYMQADLDSVIKHPDQQLTEPQVKFFLQQLLSGLQHCHEKGVLHRDIKGSNLLIDKNGTLKIADFGLANYFWPSLKFPLTNRVVTLWYRAPELLLGSINYGVGVDLWSVGCLLAEMFLGRPMLPGRTEVEQLHKIFKLCGAPCKDYLKRNKFPRSFKLPRHYEPSFQENFNDLPDSVFRLLTKLLSLEPRLRGTAASALEDKFFSSSPLACDLLALPKLTREEDYRVPTHCRKKHKNVLNEHPCGNYKIQRRKTIAYGDRRENFEASEPKGQEGNNNPSVSYKEEQGERSVPLLSPLVLHCDQSNSLKTEDHLDAAANVIKKPQRLVLNDVAIVDSPDSEKENRLSLFRRSIFMGNIEELGIQLN